VPLLSAVELLTRNEQVSVSSGEDTSPEGWAGAG